MGREKRRGRRSQKFDAAGRPLLVNSPSDALFTELNVPLNAQVHASSLGHKQNPALQASGSQRSRCVLTWRRDVESRS